MPKIFYIIGLGDSLSDRGAMNHRKLFGFIPMDNLTGLQGKSPMGRFTNGYTWLDQFLWGLLAGFNIAQEKYGSITRKLTKEEIQKIAEEIFTNSETAKTAEKTIDLTDDGFVFNQKTLFARTRCEGGLTAHSWAGRPSYNPIRFITRFILSTLEAKRNLTFDDDQLGHFDEKHKKRTLVIEWSGANDLMTANKEPSEDIADLAIAARIKNIKQMITKGYRNFVLFNLPDLSLTPRYQRLSNADQVNAQKCCEYFNKKLLEKCRKIQTEYPRCKINVFDINKTFTETYKQAKNNQHVFFTADKLKIPFTETRDCVIDANGNCNPEGYMFWDDVHPTEAVHGVLAKEFYKAFPKFFYSPPPSPKKPQTEESLFKLFEKKYNERIKKDKKINWFASSRLFKTCLNEPNLSGVLEHALFNGGNRSYQVLIELGWINAEGKLNYMEPALRQAMKKVIARRNKKPASTITAAELIQTFMARYQENLDNSKFSLFNKSRLAFTEYSTPEEKLKTILKHALYNNGKRSLKIIQALGWVDKKNNLKLNDNDALKKAYAEIQSEHLNAAQGIFCEEQDAEFMRQFNSLCEKHKKPIIQSPTPRIIANTINNIHCKKINRSKSKTHSDKIAAISILDGSPITKKSNESARLAAPKLDTMNLNEEMINDMIERGWIMIDSNTKKIIPLHPSLAPTIGTHFPSSATYPSK